MFSKLFGFKKKESIHPALGTNPYAFLGTDMHSHLLPGIDDGAQTIEDSLRLIRSLMAMGYTNFITTPHIKSDIYPNTTVTIQNALRELQQALAANNINVPIQAAAEYYIDDRFFDIMDSEGLLTLHKNEVLVEFSFVFEPVRLNDTIFRIQTKGYNPVFAHPERYPFFQHKPEVFQQMKDRGCLLQLNTLSLTGYYGKSVKETAERILQERLYDYCGTDLHHEKHVEGLQKFAASKGFSLLREYPFLNVRMGR